MSRLQCVQAAIESQIQEMAIAAGKRKVGIVTFNNEVTIVGDGTQNPVRIAGDKLHDFDFMVQTGQKASQNLSKTVAETAKGLNAKLHQLEETGPTALGPAVLTSVALACEGKPGSIVVICTDGLANIGLGAFDDVKTQEALLKVESFYEQVGQLAQKHGVTVNIVSIEGDECNIDSLSKLAELTGGMVDRVNPTNLTSNFANILATPVIATNVTTKVKIHKGL